MMGQFDYQLIKRELVMKEHQKKQEIADLALFGGEKACREPLYVGRPNIGDKEIFLKRMEDILDRKWLTNDGIYIAEFERQLATKLGVKHCVAMSNGTVALEIASRALGMTGEVIVPSFTFIATPHCLFWQGINPVFCDICPETYTADPASIEKLITPRTTGIIGVHLWGQICNIQQLENIARRHNLRLLFDAAHAFGCSYNGQMIGSFGDAEVFSFHATKFLNSFEGGAIATNNDLLAEKVRLMKNFGFVGVDDVGYAGTNGKMSEPSAAMGITSLESMDEFVETNRKNYLQYNKLLSGVPGIKLLIYNQQETSNYQYIIIEIDSDKTNIDRDDIARVLQAENIFVRRYFYPGCHNQEPYSSYFPYAKHLLPITEEVSKKVLCLPTGTSIGEADITKVCELIAFTVANGKEIGSKISPELPILSHVV